MKKAKSYGYWIAGAIAGAANGFFGAGGGMLLVPLLSAFTDLEDSVIFPTSVSIILPICVVSLSFSAFTGPLPTMKALPYLIGGLLGGILCVIVEKRLPTIWLHRIFGGLIVFGAIRTLL
jgi:uncharacterized membrane protein YfcA